MDQRHFLKSRTGYLIRLFRIFINDAVQQVIRLNFIKLRIAAFRSSVLVAAVPKGNILIVGVAGDSEALLNGHQRTVCLAEHSIYSMMNI